MGHSWVGKTIDAGADTNTNKKWRWLGQPAVKRKDMPTKELGQEEDIGLRETKKRKFNCKWLTGHEWLVYDHENSVCSVRIAECIVKKNTKRSISW